MIGDAKTNTTPDFRVWLQSRGLAPVRRDRPRTLQVNVGKRCNQACHHCHVDAGPQRTEAMEQRTAERVVALLANSPSLDVLDLTGGAPELNPGFPFLVEQARRLGRRVIVRCNLTITLEPGMGHLPRLYRDHGVELVCSLPCYTAATTDRQRGHGVFERSIRALRNLNQLGYGRSHSALVLNLVYNPLGACLPPPQETLESRYREELGRLFDIEFHQLLTIANMPIKRFADQLRRWGKYGEYMGLLVNHFNPQTLPNLMCRHLVSVGWDGTLYDCDFNQMLELPIPAPNAHGRGLTLWELQSADDLTHLDVTTGHHCFGCTAGSGSSCGGALA
ncbi:MAG: arsenosugar biosynthesis radical SAM (seleno)protein ArsS [Candidatus Binatia bacterium]